MLVYAGIDEAGYGPMLGPLCVGATVFALEGHDPEDGAPDLWRALSSAVCRKPSDRRGRIAVDDSKNLKTTATRGRSPLRHLERGVLSFLPDEVEPDCDDALFAALGVTVPERPWLVGPVPLPLGRTDDELRIDRARLHRAADGAGVRCLGIRCAAVDAGSFNRGLPDGGKAALNFRTAMALVDRVWRTWPDAHPRVILDRHGGRTHYAGLLRSHLAAEGVETVAETPTLSRYVLARGGAHLTVSFAAGGDARFLPVALASMTAKYVRELFMLRLNRFFISHRPELKPTAGYVQDARRYLRDIADLVEELGVEREEFVRKA